MGAKGKAPGAPAISEVIKYKNDAAVKASEETRPKNASVYFIIKVKQPRFPKRFSHNGSLRRVFLTTA